MTTPLINIERLANDARERMRQAAKLMREVGAHGEAEQVETLGVALAACVHRTKKVAR